MTENKRSLINRKNAAHSTGPRSVRGKASSARNSQRHGLFSQSLILADEQQEDFDLLLSELQADWRPVGITENLLVERIAIAFWRQRRLVRVETAQLRLNQRAGENPSSSTLARYLNQAEFRDANDVINQKNLPLLGDAELWQVALLEFGRTRWPDQDQGYSGIESQAPAVAKAVAILCEYLDLTPDEWVANLVASDEGFWQGLHSALRLECNRWDYLQLKQLLTVSRTILPESDRFVRYQSSLDSDIIKIARELRTQQSYRLSSLTLVPADVTSGGAALTKRTEN
jgi:hypothetical protein